MITWTQSYYNNELFNESYANSDILEGVHGTH